MTPARAQAAVLCAVVGAWALYSLPASLYDNVGEAKAAQYTEAGEALLHGAELAEGSVAYNRPLESLLAARLFSHGGARGGVRVKRLSAVLLLALLFTAGALLGDARAGPAAAALLLFFAPKAWHYASGYPQCFVAVFALALLCAALLPKSFRRRRPAFAAAAGAGLWLSPVFAPFAVLVPLLDSDLKLRRRLLWAALPFLLLAPWTAANLRLGNGWVFFDAGRSHEAWALAAVGRAPSETIDWREPQEEAAGPSRYLKGLVARLDDGIRLSPILFLALLASVIGLGADKTARAAPLLGLTLWAGTLAAASEPRDYEALWPVAALSAAAWALRRRRRAQAAAPRGAVHAAAAACVLCALLLLDAAFIVSRYPSRLAHGLSGSEDAWFFARRSRMRLDSGGLAEAAADLDRALSLKPGERELHIQRAWVAALAGAPEELWALEVPEELDEVQQSFRLKALKAAAAFAAGDAAGGAKRLEEAAAYWNKERGGDAGRALTSLRLPARGPMAPKSRMELLRALSSLYPADRGLLLEFLEAAAAASSAPGMAHALGLLGELSSEEARRAADSAAPEFAAEALRILAAARRSDAGLWLRLAEAEFARGKTPAAWAALDAGARAGSEPMRRLSAAAHFLERR